jgi:hypothetical protein
MAERLFLVSEPELEAALTELGRHLAYPPTPDLAAAVRQQLAQRPGRPRTLWAALAPLQRRVALAVLVLLVVASAVLAISPDAREAVAERLGLRGVQLTQRPAAPSPLALATPSVISIASLSPVRSTTAGSIGARLNLGQALTLEQVRARVSYDVELPAALGAPDEIYLLDTPPGGQVALVYYPRPDLIQANTTGVGVLLTEFQGNVHSTGAIGKGLSPGTRLEEVQVNGGRAFWIDGDPHVFFYMDARGQVQTETSRLAANVLLWEHGEMTFRLESALPRDTALAIAESVQ